MDMAENTRPSAAAVESMLKTRTELGDILPPQIARTNTAARVYPDPYHASRAAAGPGTAGSIGPTGQSHSAVARPRGLRYPPGHVYGRVAYRPTMLPSQGSSRRRYHGATYLHPSGYAPIGSAPLRRQPSYSSLGSSNTYASAKGTLTSLDPRALMSLGHRANQSVGTDLVGRVRRCGASLEPTSSLRAIQTYSYLEDDTAYVYDYSSVRLPASFPDADLSAQQSRRGPRRRPFLSNSAPPSSSSGTEPPAESPMSAASEHRSGKGKAPVPVFYDYTEGFGEEEFFTAKGSSASSSSQGTRDISGNAASRALKAHLRDASDLSIGVSHAGSGNSSGLSVGISDLAIPRKHHPSIRRPRDVSRHNQKGSVSAEEYYEDALMQLGEEPTQSKSSFELDDRGHTLADKTLDPEPYGSASGQTSQSADASQGSSGNWKRIDYGSKDSHSDLNVPYAASFHASEERQGTDSEADPSDGTSSEVAWRRTHLELECQEGTLADLNTFGVNARNYRRANMPLAARKGDKKRIDENEYDVVHRTSRGKEVDFGDDEYLQPRPLKSSESPAITKIPTTPTEEEQPMLSKASFPWLVKDAALVTANSSQNSLSPPLHRTSSQSSQSPEARLLRVVNASSPLLPVPGSGIASLASLGGRGSITQTPPRFKIRLQRSYAGQSASSVERRPWNVDENYPWAASPDIRVDLPALTSTRRQSPVKGRKFKLKMLARSRLGKKRFVKNTSTSANLTVAGEPTTMAIGSGNKAWNRGCLLRDGSASQVDVNQGPPIPVHRSPDGGSTADATSPGPMTSPNETPQEPSPASGLIHAENPLEMRSVFSDDSSEEGEQQQQRQSSVKERFSSLRARFAESRAFGRAYRREQRGPRGLSSTSPTQSKSSRDDDLPSPSYHPHFHRHPHERLRFHSPPRDPNDHDQDRHRREQATQTNSLRQRTWRAGRAVAGKLRRWVARRREQVSRLRKRKSVMVL